MRTAIHGYKNTKFCRNYNCQNLVQTNNLTATEGVFCVQT